VIAGFSSFWFARCGLVVWCRLWFAVLLCSFAVTCVVGMLVVTLFCVAWFGALYFRWGVGFWF